LSFNLRRLMKIAIISTLHTVPWGGSEELWAAMAREAVDLKHEVVISVYEWPATPDKIADLARQGARVLKRPNPYSAKQNSLIRRGARKIQASLPVLLQPGSPFRTLFDVKPDVVCIGQAGPYDTILLTRDLAELLESSSVPYVVVCQYNKETFPLNEAARESAKQFLSRAFRVAFVAEESARTAERQLAASLPNAMVVRNPVNLTDLSAVPWPSLGQACLASVARLEVDAKGQDTLFEALSSPAWRGRDWQLRLYGQGPDDTYLRKLARHYGISERVVFMGQVSDVRSIWSENHLLVLPSRVEGTPLAMVEAMLCGRPSVVTDVGGNTEWVAEPQTGFVAEASTARSFGAALERAWLTRARWEEIGKRAREQALTQYDQEAGKSLLRIILEAVGLQSLRSGAKSAA